MNDRIVMDGIELLDSALVAWHVRATVGLAVVVIAGLALRSCGERTRHRVLAWGLLATVALPTAAAFAPGAWGLPVGTRPQIEAVDPAPALATARPHLALSSGQVTTTTTTATQTFDSGTAVLLLWIVGAGMCLAGVGAAAVGSLSLRKGAGAVSPTTRALFDELQTESGTSARLGITPSVDGPIVVGVLAPTVLLPREAVVWSEVRLRAVLAHELGHIAHGDHRWFPLAYAVRGLLWFNPLAWLVTRTFFRAAEFSADEAAISGGMKAPSYAAQLLSLANNGVSVQAPMLAAAALGRPDVGTRIRRLLTTPPSVAQLRRIVPVSLGLLGASTCIVLARPATVIPNDADDTTVSVSEASNLLPVPDGTDRVSLRGGGIVATANDGETWSHEPGLEPQRQGHLLVSLYEFLAAHGETSRPLVVDADRSVSFAALVEVLYTAGRAGITSYYLQVPTAAGPRVLSISPPRFIAAGGAPRAGPALRVGIVVGEHQLRVATRPSQANPPRYEDPQLTCLARVTDSAELRRAALGLCAAVDGVPIEMAYSGLQSTNYGTLTDTIVATALPCGGAQLIEAGVRFSEPEDGPDCDDVLADFRLTTAQ